MARLMVIAGLYVLAAVCFNAAIVFSFPNLEPPTPPVNASEVASIENAVSKGVLFPPPPAPSVPPLPPQTWLPTANKSAICDISCSFVSWGEYDYKFMLHPDGWKNRCMDSVRLAKERCGGKAFNFVPTHFWDELFDDNSVKSYCIKTNHGTDWEPVVCEPITQAMIDAFELGYKHCFMEVAKVGFKEIHILPHIDEGAQRGGWRNALLLDPFTVSSGFSYIDIMIAPLTRALKDTLDVYPEMKVGFALQGEMSYAVLVYPNEWMRVYDGVKYYISNGDPEKLENVHVGVSFNSNKLCGLMKCSELAVTETQFQVQPLMPNGTAINNDSVPMPHISAIDIGRMFNKTDFFGISAYPVIYDIGEDIQIDVGPTSRLGGPLGSFNAELIENFQYSLSDILRWRPDVELHFSEFAVGGAGSTPQQAAETAALALRSPFNGVSGLYTYEKDPWKRPDMARLRYVFWQQTARWLSQGSDGAWPISHLFMWNLYSWDPVAIHWATVNRADNSSYFDPRVSECIVKWNEERELCGYEWPPMSGDWLAQWNAQQAAAAQPGTGNTTAITDLGR